MSQIQHFSSRITSPSNFCEFCECSLPTVLYTLKVSCVTSNDIWSRSLCLMCWYAEATAGKIKLVIVKHNHSALQLVLTKVLLWNIKEENSADDQLTMKTTKITFLESFYIHIITCNDLISNFKGLHAPGQPYVSCAFSCNVTP